MFARSPNVKFKQKQLESYKKCKRGNGFLLKFRNDSFFIVDLFDNVGNGHEFEIETKLYPKGRIKKEYEDQSEDFTKLSIALKESAKVKTIKYVKLEYKIKTEISVNGELKFYQEKDKGFHESALIEFINIKHIDCLLTKGIEIHVRAKQIKYFKNPKKRKTTAKKRKRSQIEEIPNIPFKYVLHSMF